MFETEELAEKYKQEVSHASDIIKTKGKFYVSESSVGKFLQESAKEASEYYKMDVELKMDWIAGINWATTH